MRCDEFIAKYNASMDKNKFIKKHIVRTYLPYQDKIAESKEIVKRSCYVEIDGKQFFKQNSPIFFMLFMLRVITDYTDIEYENDGLTVFNALSEIGLLETIISAIPQKEYETFNTVLHMCKDDEMENYRSLAGFFDTKVDALGLSFNALAEAAGNIKQ